MTAPAWTPLTDPFPATCFHPCSVFELVAEARSEETFVALCLLTVTGASLITQRMGFSDTLGAFVAGVLLSGANTSAGSCVAARMSGHVECPCAALCHAGLAAWAWFWQQAWQCALPKLLPLPRRSSPPPIPPSCRNQLQDAG